jgi:hypothetical protein
MPTSLLAVMAISFVVMLCGITHLTDEATRTPRTTRP